MIQSLRLQASSSAGYASVLGVLFVWILGITPVEAQQLRIVDEATTAIEDVTLYRAYYGMLNGQPKVFSFTAAEEMSVQFVALIPDMEDASTTIALSLIDLKNPQTPVAALDGATFEWTRFFDTVGRDSYLAGPIIKETIPAGTYEVRVSRPVNTGPYVIVVGETERFSVGEIMRRYLTLPRIKADFFNKSAAEAYVTPLLLWPVFGVLIIVGLALFSLIIYTRRRTDAG